MLAAPFELSEAQLAEWLAVYLLPLFRIGALFTVMPVIGARMVPARVRVLLALLVGILAAPLLPPADYPALLSPAWLLLIAGELSVGLMLGFVLQIFLQIFVLAGQLMATKMGLGFASMNDPANGVQTTVLSQFYLLLATLLFVIANGHIVVIGLVVESFTSMPPGRLLDVEQLHVIVSLGTWLFTASLIMALPVMIALLIVNTAFGVMSRAAPQLNIFALGFPLSLMAGMAIVAVSLGSFGERFNELWSECWQLVMGLVGL